MDKERSEQSERYEFIEFNLSAHGQVHFEIFSNNHRYVAPHWHDSFEIISVLDGELLISTEQKRFALGKGDCIILNPYVVHSTVSIKGNSSLMLQIPVDAFADCLDSASRTRIICNPFTTDPDQRASLLRITELLKQIMTIMQSGLPAGRLRCMSVLLELMYEMYTGLALPSTDDIAEIMGENKKRERLSAAIAYTTAHYQDSIMLEEVAKTAHLQVNYFCQFFKKHMGMTYLQYLNEYRLSKVYHDMVETDLPLNALLERHGFSNHKLFRRMFVQQFGCAPGEFRKMHGDTAGRG